MLKRKFTEPIQAGDKYLIAGRVYDVVADTEDGGCEQCAVHNLVDIAACSQSLCFVSLCHFERNEPSEDLLKLLNSI